MGSQSTVFHQKRSHINFLKNFKMVKFINVLGLALIGAAMAKPPTSKKEAKALFNDINTNGDKRVDAEELALYVASLGYGSQEDARSTMSSADKNGDGQLSFKEFWNSLKEEMDNKTDDDNQQKRTRIFGPSSYSRFVHSLFG